MTQKTDNWSNDWNSSKNPSKQRKYRDNAPLHVKDKLISANLDQELREELGTRNIKVRTGDRAKVMRGDFSGSEGIINNIDREEEVVYINGIEVEKQDGTKQQVPFPPSNLQIVALNVEDSDRVEKYEVEDITAIEVDEEEVEEALEEDEEAEMMQQMQGGESGAHEQYEEDEEDTDSEEEPAEDGDESPEQEETDTSSEVEADEEEETDETEEAASADYSEIVSGTISDAKDQLQELDNPDYSAALDAEKEGKNRTTFIDWLESQQD